MKFRLLLLLLVCLVAVPVSSSYAALTVFDTRKSLVDLPERKLPEAEQQAAQQALEQTLGWLEKAEQHERAQRELQEQLAGAPKKIADTQVALQRLRAADQDAPSKRLAQASVSELEHLLAERNQQLRVLQKELGDANALIITAQTRPERAQADISSNQARIQEINALLKTAKDSNKALTNEQTDALKAELLALEQKNNLRRAELTGNSVLQELGSSLSDFLQYKVGLQEQDILALQSLLNEKRQAESEKTVAELALEVSKAGTDSLLLRESSLNLKLSDYLLTVTERRNQLTRRNLLVRQQLDSVQQTEQALEEQISVLQGSLLLAKILYQQKQALTQVSFDRGLADQIADTRLYQFELRQLRDTVSRPDEYVQTALKDMAEDEERKTLSSSLLDLVRSRAELLDKVNRELNAFLSESITLQLNQKQLQSMTDALRLTLDEQMFWIPSNKPLDWDWLKAAPERLQYQLTSVLWQTGVSQVGASLAQRASWLIPLFFLMLLAMWKRPKVVQALRNLHADIGHFRHDSQWHTPRAIALNLLLALPGAIIFATLGMMLLDDGNGYNLEVGQALLNMAQVWLVFYCAYRILAPNGMAIMHFRWSRAQVAFLQPRIRTLGLTTLMLTAVVTIAQARPAALSDDVVGIIVLVTCLLLLSWTMTGLVFHRYSSGNDSLLRRLVGAVVVLMPLLFAAALVSGYYYTAIKLSARLLNTLSLVLIWILLEAVIVRGLALAARRLAWQRVQDAKQNQPKDGMEGEVATDDMLLDISQINEQSLRLARLILFGGFFVSLYWVWSDLLSLFTYLENITLYENVSSTGAVLPTSLRDFLDAGVIIVISIALARNLPGLLEVLFLSRLKLAQGSAYATTTLLSYTISATGFVATLSALGVSWDKLQWLVAALSVGLGFGLQEIFANFVSGLIILFERPVRIGDVVTIGNLSGTVSRIRIRATTITDFDRKEIIVPNKVFVTDQLVNWSLTDTITRVVIQVGIAYDSDMDLAHKLMMQAMQENPRVMRDPEPIVLFLGITPNTFQHELRFYVRELGDRNPSIDEILNRLVLSFRDHKVDMAFNQVDVFVKNRETQEQQLLHTQSNPLADNQAPKA